jgi:hypothetical protein
VTSHAPAALYNRAGRAWHQHLGRPAWLALVVLAAGAAVQWRLLPEQGREQQRLKARLLALPAATAAPASAWAAAAAPLELPPLRQRGTDVELIVEAAQRSGLGLERADYALAAPAGNAATRLQVSLPLSGTYSGLRRYVATVLNTLPHAALESLSIERADAQSAQLQATAKLVLFYRSERP